MSKCFFILCLLISASHGVYAQIDLEVRTGAGISSNSAEVFTATGPEDVSPDPFFSYFIGLSARKELIKRLYLSPEILYSRRGNISTEPSFTIKTVVDYLTVPVWLEYEMFDRFYIKTGAEFAYLLDQKIKFNDETVSLERQVNGKTTDLGVMTGFRYQVGPQWAIHFRATFGLFQQWRPWYINSQFFERQLPPRAYAIFCQNVTQRSYFIGIGYTLVKK